MNLRLQLLAVFVACCAPVLAFADNSFDLEYQAGPNNVRIQYAADKYLIKFTTNDQDVNEFPGKVKYMSFPQKAQSHVWPKNIQFTAQKNPTQGKTAGTFIIAHDEDKELDYLHLNANGYTASFPFPEGTDFPKKIDARMDTIRFYGRAAQVITIHNVEANSVYCIVFLEGHFYVVVGMNVRPKDVKSIHFTDKPDPNLPSLTWPLEGPVKINGKDYELNQFPDGHAAISRSGDQLAHEIADAIGGNDNEETEIEPSKALVKVEPGAYNAEAILSRDEIVKFQVPDVSGDHPVSLKTLIERDFEVIRGSSSSDANYEYYGKELEIAAAALMMKQSGGVRVLGRAGTGKSHFTKVLIAYLLNRSQSPEFKDRIYLRINSSSLQAGTKYTGMFEARVYALKMLAERVPLVLVVDEIHTLIGAGTSASHPNDFFQIIKDELAEGKIKIIGNTTDAEWERNFSGDAAMVRRFPVTVKIEEPPREKMLGIARTFLAERYKDTKIQISDEVITQISAIASRFNPLGANPDKTIQLLDFVMAYTASQNQSEVAAASLLDVASLRYNYNLNELTADKISTRVANLNTEMDKKLIGLARAKQLIQQAVADHFFHQINGESSKPTAMLAYGKRGTGKTTLGRALADGLGFRFTRMMMSEFALPSSADDFKTKLGLALQANPFHVVLFDEVEKAHPLVQQTLLRILDEGVFDAHLSKIHNQSPLTEVDASKAIFFAATNAGQAIADKPAEEKTFEDIAESEGLNRYVLDRFGTFVPVETPTTDTVQVILKNKLEEKLQAFTGLGRKVQINNEEVMKYLMKQVSPEDRAKLSVGFVSYTPAGGTANADLSVRSLERQLLEISQMVSLYFVKNPNATEVSIRIENGKLVVGDVVINLPAPLPEKKVLNLPGQLLRARYGGFAACQVIHLQ